MTSPKIQDCHCQHLTGLHRDWDKILGLLLLLLRRGRGAEYCNQFVCLCMCLSTSISGTGGPIFTKFVVQIPCGRGSVLQALAALRYVMYFRFIDDVTFSRSGPYGDAWLMSMNALLLCPGRGAEYCKIVLCDIRDTSVSIAIPHVTIPVSPRSR